MLTSLSYDMKLPCRSNLNSLDEILSHTNGEMRVKISNHDMEANKKTLHWSVTHSHALDGLLIG